VIVTIYFIDRENSRTTPALQMGLLALVLKLGTAQTNLKTNYKNEQQYFIRVRGIL
jgi:hypothetical protein